MRSIQGLKKEAEPIPARTFVPPQINLDDFEAVLFDMDGTLVDSEPIWFAVLQNVMQASGGHLPSEAHGQLHGLDRASTTSILQDQYGLDREPTAFWGTVILELADALASVREMPGASAWIQRCVDRNLPRAVVSNSPRAMIEASLAPQSWGAHLGVRVSVEDVARGKPAPDSYLLACERLNVDPAKSLVIEDSEAGAHAARSAGATLLFVTNGYFDVSKALTYTPYVASSLEAWL